jgi:ATP-dependent Clp protease ATP-binding subunit ClpC
MFERYTESARRVLFFARYEATQWGSPSIETEHVLLGLIRDPGSLATRVVLARGSWTLDGIRMGVDQRVTRRERYPESVEIPFSSETKRALEYAAEEADRLGHSYIGNEHLLLALLRETRTVAGSILESVGLDHDAVRKAVVDLLKQGHEAAQASLSQRTLASFSAMVANLDARLDSIRRLVDQLAQAQPGTPEAQSLLETINRELDNLKPPSGFEGFSRSGQ